jgi:hypothetical protein
LQDSIKIIKYRVYRSQMPRLMDKCSAGTAGKDDVDDAGIFKLADGSDTLSGLPTSV